MQVASRMKRVGASLLWFLLGSTLSFGLAFGLVALVEGGPSLPNPVEAFSFGFSASIALYGLFHWALLALFTFPLFVLPLTAFLMMNRTGARTMSRVRQGALIIV